MSVEFALTSMDATSETLNSHSAHTGKVFSYQTGRIDIKGSVIARITEEEVPELRDVLQGTTTLVPKNKYINDENTFLTLRGILTELMRIRDMMGSPSEEFVPLAADQLAFAPSPVPLDKFLLTISHDTHKILTMLRNEKAA